VSFDEIEQLVKDGNASDEWTIRLSDDLEAALFDFRKKKYWKGSVSIPVNAVVGTSDIQFSALKSPEESQGK
jgi:hypothetical protein